MQPITDRQQQVLDFVISYLDEQGCPPTLREISDYIGVRGTATATLHLEALQRKGYLRRREGSPRNISLVGRPTVLAVPIAGKVRAGTPESAIEDIRGYYNLDMSWVNDKGCFFLQVEGDSMVEANILDGDLALITPQPTAENGQIVVALINGEATLKRFYRERGRVRLQPENRSMLPIIIHEGDAETVIVGRLLKIIRNFP